MMKLPLMVRLDQIVRMPHTLRLSQMVSGEASFDNEANTNPKGTSHNEAISSSEA